MIKVYVAFSIHGTNAFITASTTVNKIEDLGREFTEVRSRRPDYKSEDGIKLHWNALLTEKKQPYKSAAWVLNRFNILQRNGWVVDKKAFLERHYPACQ